MKNKGENPKKCYTFTACYKVFSDCPCPQQKPSTGEGPNYHLLVLKLTSYNESLYPEKSRARPQGRITLIQNVD